jgi:hypothetical protein
MIDLEDMKKLFADNAFYLLAHHRRILSDSRLSLCRVPVKPLFMASEKCLTLGCCIGLWKDYSLTRFYSGEKNGFTEADATHAGTSMMKTLICPFQDSGAGSCTAVRNNGEVIEVGTYLLWSYREYRSVFCNIAKKYNAHAKISKSEILSLPNVIDLLRKEDLNTYPDGETALENYNCALDEVFEGTRQWLSECKSRSFIHHEHYCGRAVISLNELQNIRKDLTELLKPFPNHPEYSSVMSRMESGKDLCIRALPDSTAAALDDFFWYCTEKYRTLVPALRSDAVLAVYQDYMDTVENNGDIQKVNELIRATKRELRNATVTQGEGSKRIAVLDRRKKELLSDAETFLRDALTVILGNNNYHFLKFDNRNVLEHFVAKCRREKQSG